MKKSKLLMGILSLTVALFGFSACEIGGTIFYDTSSSLESSSLESSPSHSNSADSADGTQPPEDIVTADMSIHFLYFNNIVSGDCTLIKVGDTEVLIDAGSTRGATRTTIPYIQQYCTDGVLEYVVATHAHSDHISGFLGLEEKDRKFPEDGQGVFEAFECQTIIDYTARKTDSALSKNYEAARDKEVADHGGAHYTALECWNNENGAKRSYTLGEGITMNILYQQYYEQSTSNENNYSVCVMISQGDNHYLFTGDLESAGEKSLAENNDLPKCKLYKGGHHGSKTSSTDILLAEIQPEIVCVCSCCGDSNGFVHQEFLDRVSVYTDRVYVTTMRGEVNGVGTPFPINGNIVVTASGEGVEVHGSNNDILFKDCQWFLDQIAAEKYRMPDAWKTGA